MLRPDLAGVVGDAELVRRVNDDDVRTGGSDFGVAGWKMTVWLSTDGGSTWNKVYIGPKDKSTFDKDPLYRQLGFVNTIDFQGCCCPTSIINPLAFGILAIMKWMHVLWPHNYGIVIIVLVLLMRLALHPNDPPVPLSRGSEQIMGTVEGWKRLIGIVNSPANGITFDCGVTREIGDDPVAVCRYFATRDRINHMHFRNVRMHVPREKYEEVFVDEGDVDMFGVMRELVRNGYALAIYPEHPRALDYDRDAAKASGGLRGYPGGGGYAGDAFNVAYTRAMLQAAASAQTQGRR